MMVERAEAALTLPAFLAGIVRAADRALGASIRAARWLALPLGILLFLQWPLRDWIQAWSREANDLAQVIFAFYVAVGVSAATRANAHLAVGSVRHDARRGAARVAAALVVLAAAIALAVVAAPPIWRSIRVLEAFPETYTPGYFALKIALAVLTVAALVQALVDLFKSPEPS